MAFTNLFPDKFAWPLLCLLTRMKSIAGVLCEVVNPEDGSMSRTPQLLEFAKQHRLRCITIADLVRYRLQYDVYGTELPATQAQ